MSPHVPNFVGTVTLHTNWSRGRGRVGARSTNMRRKGSRNDMGACRASSSDYGCRETPFTRCRQVARDEKAIVRISGVGKELIYEQ